MVRNLSSDVPGAIGSSTSKWDQLKAASQKGSVEGSVSRPILNKPAADTPEKVEKGFSLYISGRIESGQFANVSDLVCAYEVVTGSDWQLQNVSIGTKPFIISLKLAILGYGTG
mmetsp:Transcript_40912/g.65738  ORF Transcript_40912/g.65738 Transcript_40912/m.65738 type:complete len:114 (+) Transcript_40912:162-503(+)